MDKYEIFRYFIIALINNGIIKEDNDFSVLKVLKLLFLTCQASSMVLDKDVDLFQKFTFNAFTYGPVERDIYDKIKNDYFKEDFTITTEKTLINSNIKKDFTVNIQIVTINAIIKQFSNLFKMRAFDLVELTHKYNSWSEAFKEKTNSNPYPKMNVELMRSENLLV